MFPHAVDFFYGPDRAIAQFSRASRGMDSGSVFAINRAMRLVSPLAANESFVIDHPRDLFHP